MKTGLHSVGHIALLLTLSLSITACNKDEYFAKEPLLQSIEGPGGVDEGSGGTSGGSSTGGTSGGSSSGGTSGGSSSSGGSSGGSTTGTTAGGTSGGSYTSAEETFNQSASQTKKLDIIWVIDNSGSMADEQDELGSNFSSFIDEFINKDVDFRMGITTTDTRSGRKGVMVAGSDIKLNSSAAQANPGQFKADFNRMVQVGINGWGNERGLEGAEGFMQLYSSTFIRQDAVLAVVILSDEEDQSPKSVEEYTNILKSYKNSAGLVKVYSIVDVNKTNSGSGITTGGDRYIDASSRTAGVSADIRANFHQVLSAMGDSIINLLDSFALAADPVPGTLKVYVNGVLNSNYTFDAASRSIKFNANAVPTAGAVIKVTYSK